MKQQKIEFKNSKSQKLTGILHIPDGEARFPAVIFCHGYRSTKESQKAVDLSRTIPEQGLVFMRFDFSGRGESNGKFEDTTITQHIDDLKSAVDFISCLDFVDKEKIGIIGNSLGGLIALQETAKNKKIKCLVLQSPVSVFPWKKIKEFSKENIAKWRKQGWTYTHCPRFGKMKINYGFYKDGLRYNNSSVYENIKIPVLVIHGTVDKSVSIDSSKELISHLENAEFIVLEGADHGYANKTDYGEVITKTTKFLSGHLKMSYSEKVMEKYVHPKNMGKIEKPEACGNYKSSVCGDFMDISLKIKDNQIIDAKFNTFGCCAAVSSGDVLCEMIKGMNLNKISNLTKDDIVKNLDGLPGAKVHCAELSFRTLKRAIENYKKKGLNNKKIKNK